MGLATWLLWVLWERMAPEASKFLAVVWLIVTIGLSAGIYVIMALMLRVPDLREAMDTVLRGGVKHRHF